MRSSEQTTDDESPPAGAPQDAIDGGAHVPVASRSLRSSYGQRRSPDAAERSPGRYRHDQRRNPGPRRCSIRAASTPASTAHTRGFTLIEILVALAVLAVAMGAIIGATARYADNAAYLREKTLATWVARNRLAEFLAAPVWPATGESDGDARMGEQDWFWHAQVSGTQDPQLRRIDVEVRASKNGAPVASLSGFMAAPAGTNG